MACWLIADSLRPTAFFHKQLSVLSYQLSAGRPESLGLKLHWAPVSDGRLNGQAVFPFLWTRRVRVCPEGYAAFFMGFRV
jgi:hypothetical protein